ncbi:MAG: redoxin domain-containing protein [Planctomycetota bacterium]|jgi:hypothetical protein
MARSVILLVLVSLLVGLAGCGDGSATSAAARPSHLVSLAGSDVTIDDALVTDVTTFIFVRHDCPIANRYAPVIQRLHETYAARGVTFWVVYPDAEETAASIRTHLKEYALPCDALRDPHHALVKRTGAKVTPEAAVFRRDGTLAYCGRIDDLYVAFGTARQEPTTHDLADALDAVLAGRDPAAARTPAVGCYIADLQ